ncbi:MAG: M48 family metalloprotease, partial [Natronospirillum sp.]
MLITTLILVTVARSDVLISDLPALGQQDFRTQVQETSSGLRYLRFLNAQGLSTQDPAVTYYLEQSIAPLVPTFSTENDVHDLLIFGVNHRSFNAFALPGGLIGVHQGLLTQLKNTAEVQAIMAHEMGHLALGHHQRLAQSQRQSTGLIIASILLAPLALQVDTDLALGMIYGAQGLAIQQQLAFSRNMEEEADRIAVSAMRSGGLPLSGFVGAYETMASHQRMQTGSAVSLYPTTHPDVRVRLADLQNRLGGLNVPDRTLPDIALCWLQLDRGAPARDDDERCTDYATLQDKAPADQAPLWQHMLNDYPANPYLIYRAAEWVDTRRALEGADTLLDQLSHQATLAPDSWLVALSMLILDDKL